MIALRVQDEMSFVHSVRTSTKMLDIKSFYFVRVCFNNKKTSKIKNVYEGWNGNVYEDIRLKKCIIKTLSIILRNKITNILKKVANVPGILEFGFFSKKFATQPNFFLKLKKTNTNKTKTMNNKRSQGSRSCKDKEKSKKMKRYYGLMFWILWYRLKRKKSSVLRSECLTFSLFRTLVRLKISFLKIPVLCKTIDETCYHEYKGKYFSNLF